MVGGGGPRGGAISFASSKTQSCSPGGNAGRRTMATGRGAGFGVLLPVLLELAYVVSPPPLKASQGLPLGASMTLRSCPPRPICRIECSVDESPCSLAARPVPTAAWAARSRFCFLAKARMWSSASRRIVAALQLARGQPLI